MSLRLRFLLSALVLVLTSVIPIGWYSVRAIDRSIDVWHDSTVRDALERSLRSLDDPREVGIVRDALIRYRQLGALRRPLERRTLLVGAGVTALAFLVAAGIAWVFAVELTRPLRRVSLAAERIAEGDLTQSVPPSRIREIGALIDAFNRMVVGLRESREALARAERRAAWQDIARAIAHEIKNPLTPMRLTTQRLRARFGDNRERFEESFMRSTEMILAEIDRLERLANAFSSFAKMPAPVMQPLDLRDVVGAVGELFAADRESGRLAIAVPDRPVPVLGDRQQLEQALLNLAKNGIEAVADGEGRVSISLRRRDDRAVLDVSDDGPGIPDDVLGRIFQPYVTTKPGGSGIGLAIVDRVVSEHGGRVTAGNMAPHGASFEITLPLAAEEVAHARAHR